MITPLCHYFLFIAIKNAEAELGGNNKSSSPTSATYVDDGFAIISYL